jgi:hypothetical protein
MTVKDETLEAPQNILKAILLCRTKEQLMETLEKIIHRKTKAYFVHHLIVFQSPLVISFCNEQFPIPTLKMTHFTSATALRKIQGFWTKQ